MSSGWAGRRVDGKTHMFRTIYFIEFSNSVKYNCFYMTFATARCRQIYLFGRIHVLLGLAPRLWRVKVVRRHRGSCASHRSRAGAVARPSSFDRKTRVFFNISFFLHFCKFVCCCLHIVILMRRWCCFGGGVFNISKTLPMCWLM